MFRGLLDAGLQGKKKISTSTENVLINRIGGISLPDYFVRQRWGLSGLKHAGRPKIGQFSLHLRNLNESSIGDAVATFFR